MPSIELPATSGGAVGLPDYSASDLTLGSSQAAKWTSRTQLKSPSDGTLTLSNAAGTLGLTLSTTGIAITAAGLAAGFANAGSPTGLYIGATNTCDLYVSGTSALAIDASRNVTIPAGQLKITSAGTSTAPAWAIGNEQTGMYMPASGQIGFVANGSPVMRFENLSNSVRYKNMIGSSDLGFSWYSSNDVRLMIVDGTNGLILNSRDGMVIRGGTSNTGQAICLMQSNVTSSALSGATYTATNLIYPNSYVLGITIRVTTAVTGATSFDIGDGTTVNKFATAVGLGTGPAVFLPGLFPYTASTNVVLTANGSNFTGGIVKISVHFIQLQAQTS